MEKVHLARVGTTMEAARAWVDALYEKGDDSVGGSSKGAIIYADVQDQGRGSKGRQWESSTAGNVYVTYAIPLQSLALDKFTVLPAIIALSVCKALSPYLGGSRHRLRVKWPNDVLDERGRKISGSIVETHREFILIGIGINVVDVVTSSPSFSSSSSSSSFPFMGGGGRVPCSLKDLVVDGAVLPSVEEVVDRMYEEGLKVYVGMVGNDVACGERERNGEWILREWSEYVDWSAPVMLRDDPQHVKWIPLMVTKEGFLRIRHPETGVEKTLIDSYLN